MENEDVLLVRFNSVTMNANNVPEGATYHFPTKSWAFVARAFGGNVSTVGETKTGNLSNMITNKDGDILYYIYEPSVKQRILKWQHSSTSHADGTNIFFFTTKDFTFGNIAVRKKIYKVYVTYQSTLDDASSDSYVQVYYGKNGTADLSAIGANSGWTEFEASTSTNYGSNGLSGSTTWARAELLFNDSSDVKNVYSLQLKFESKASSSVPNGFMINDIEIIYRSKNVK